MAQLVTAGGGSIPRWSASKPQVVTRRKAKGAGKKKKWPPLVVAHKSELVWDLYTVQPPSRFHCRNTANKQTTPKATEHTQTQPNNLLDIDSRES